MYTQKRHLQQLTLRGIYVTTYKNVLLLFCIWTSNVSLSAYKILILRSYAVSARLHDVTNFLNQKAFSSKHVSIYYRENMTSFLNYVTATLYAWRGSYYLSIPLWLVECLAFLFVCLSDCYVHTLLSTLSVGITFVSWDKETLFGMPKSFKMTRNKRTLCPLPLPSYQKMFSFFVL